VPKEHVGGNSLLTVTSPPFSRLTDIGEED
jgi:hypothetical protein